MDFPELISSFAERHGIADLVADFRPVAKAAAERIEEEPQFGASDFVQV